MTMRIPLAICLLCVPLCAKEAYPELTSADGSKSMRAKPMAVEGEKIRFEKEGGKLFSAKPELFSAKDRKDLREWMAAMENDPHRALVNRVKQAKTLRVLFVGNSYSFEIPKVFEKLAKSEGKRIAVDQVTKGGWTLEKHAASEATLEKISGGKWDVVVLQEQSLVPSFPEEQRSRQMDAPAGKLAEAVREANAIPVFFLTWGRKDGDKQNAGVFPDDTYAAMQKRLVAGYKMAAKQAGGAHVVPVGEVWSAIRRAGKDQGLYAKDGSHPAKRGVYLGACVFYSDFYDETIQKKARDIEDADIIAGSAAAARLARLPYPLHPGPP